MLARAADPRAGELLASAHAELQARAATITDAALRESFLSNVPQHREIVAAWAALTGGRLRLHRDAGSWRLLQGPHSGGHSAVSLGSYGSTAGLAAFDPLA